MKDQVCAAFSEVRPSLNLILRTSEWHRPD